MTRRKAWPLTRPTCTGRRTVGARSGRRAPIPRRSVCRDGRDRRDAERVPGRVEKHAPSNVGLRIDVDGAQAHRSGRRRVDVQASRQIEMDDRRTGPDRRNVGSDPLRNQGDSGNPYAGTVRVLSEQLPAEQVEVERSQGDRVCAVEGHPDEVKRFSVFGHPPTLRHGRGDLASFTGTRRQSRTSVLAGACAGRP